MHRLSLSAGWQVKASDATLDLPAEFAALDGWLPANVPGSVHQDLLRAGRIPDPFFGTNEHDVKWIGETDWLYRCTFDVPDSLLTSEQVALCFDGLDTFVEVWLNGTLILVSENMFVPRRVDVRPLLKPTGNMLHIRFASAFLRGRALEEKYGPRLAWNGDTSRVYVRKAQYHYGWDWGPTLLTAGLWRPVYLEAYTTRITDLHVPAEVSADLRTATLPVTLTLDHGSTVPTTEHITLTVFSPTGEAIHSAELPVEGDTVQHTFTLTTPELWYPLGYGKQPRYRVVATLSTGGVVLDTRELWLGLRRLRVVQDPIESEPGSSFYFEVNNIPLFAGGANWIPADSFVPRLTRDRYREWLTLAAEGNMIMLRVWGGGIYEEDVFYDLCDELGLLVWQDFMFACGMYPAHPEFLLNVRAEVEANVRRLRHHACIALWCGNNEDYQVAEALHVYDVNFHGDFVNSNFPAREIYERLLPNVCGQLDPTRLYWPGSPYGGASVADQTIGDRHTWEIWHGSKADYRDYPLYQGRFVSEFGMQAAPELATIEQFTRPEDRAVHSAVMNFHNKAGEGPQRLDHYLAQNTGEASTLAEYINFSQFVQSEAVAAAADGWRRRWQGEGRYRTAGTLVWQINDCWPVTSWALVDYFLRLKPAYYRFRRSLAQVALGIAAADGHAEVWLANGTLHAIDAELDLQVWALTGEKLSQQQIRVQAGANRSTELGRFNFKAAREAGAVVSARLLQGETVLARAVLWPDPPKRFHVPDPGLSITIESSDAAKTTLRISAARPARAVVLAAGDDVKWSDNMLDIIPGDDQHVSVTGLKGDSLNMRWLDAPAEITIKPTESDDL